MVDKIRTFGNLEHWLPGIWPPWSRSPNLMTEVNEGTRGFHEADTKSFFPTKVKFAPETAPAKTAKCI